MGAEFGDFAGRFFADVNGDGDDAGKGADKDERDEPGRDMSDSQGVIKRQRTVHRHRSVEEDFCDPRHQNENENKDVIAFQPTTDRFQLADFETGQNKIFANEFFPFPLQQIAILHHHRHQKMRFQHSDARAEGVVKAITPRFDPEHHPNDGEVEKENNVRHASVGKRDGDDGGAAGDGPVRCNIEPLPPDHDPPHFAAIKMRHGVDVARIVDAPLERNGRLLGRSWCAVFSCHG